MMDTFVNKDLEVIDTSSGWTNDSIQHPKSIFTSWDNTQLSGIGVYRVVYSDDPVPDGKYIKEWSYAIDGDHANASPVYDDIPVVTPESVSKAQGKAALVGAGLYNAVVSYIDGLTGTDKILADIAFNDTTEWQRNSPFLTQAATALNITEQQLDDLFVAASKIVL